MFAWTDMKAGSMGHGGDGSMARMRLAAEALSALKLSEIGNGLQMEAQSEQEQVPDVALPLKCTLCRPLCDPV